MSYDNRELKQAIKELLEQYNAIPFDEVDLRKSVMESIKATTQELNRRKGLNDKAAQNIDRDLDSMLDSIIKSKIQLDTGAQDIERDKLRAISDWLKDE